MFKRRLFSYLIILTTIGTIQIKYTFIRINSSFEKRCINKNNDTSYLIQ